MAWQEYVYWAQWDVTIYAWKPHAMQRNLEANDRGDFAKHYYFENIKSNEKLWQYFHSNF